MKLPDGVRGEIFYLELALACRHLAAEGFIERAERFAGRHFRQMNDVLADSLSVNAEHWSVRMIDRHDVVVSVDDGDSEIGVEKEGTQAVDL